jgi:hypothetical protein
MGLTKLKALFERLVPLLVLELVPLRAFCLPELF